MRANARAEEKELGEPLFDRRLDGSSRGPGNLKGQL
jgi:hypothetical protein